MHNKDLRQKWLTKISDAQKRDADWLKKSKDIIDKYRAKNPKANSYNILFSNVDTIYPAIYNSLPKPDVRRRWSDDDPIGKIVSEIVSRSLSYFIDNPRFNKSISLCVYDYLLSGRAVARVKYIPDIESIDGEEGQEPYESIKGERIEIEHIQYDEFLIGEGKEWSDVRWIAFKQCMDKAQIEEKFGKEVSEKITYGEVDRENTGESYNTDEKKYEDGYAEIWEVWDKDTKKIIFVAKCHDEVLSVEEDNLKLSDFWSIPEPLYSVIDPSCMIPVPLYAIYEQQAIELDKISLRINKIIDAIKVRGIYDATLTELSSLMRGDDNQLIPAENIGIIIDRGGLDKAIWFLDIRPLAQILETLYKQREQTKQVIYEITGLSDIIRGSTDANETATAQGLKAQFGSQRISRMQRSVQYFIRDILRIMAEIVPQLQVETLGSITGIKLPTNQEVQMSVMRAQMTGQPPPDTQGIITVEMAHELLTDNLMRDYKIDVETDSTIAASQQQDMLAIRDLLSGLGDMFNKFAPAVQSGALPIEAVKELTLAVVRRAKMGNAVEDAFEKIQSPQQQGAEQDPQIAEMQQVIQAGMQQIQQMQAELDNKDKQLMTDYQIKKMKIDSDREVEIMKIEANQKTEREKTLTKFAFSNNNNSTT